MKNHGWSSASHSSTGKHATSGNGYIYYIHCPQTQLSIPWGRPFSPSPTSCQGQTVFCGPGETDVYMNSYVQLPTLPFWAACRHLSMSLTLPFLSLLFLGKSCYQGLAEFSSEDGRTRGNLRTWILPWKLPRRLWFGLPASGRTDRSASVFWHDLPFTGCPIFAGDTQLSGRFGEFTMHHASQTLICECPSGCLKHLFVPHPSVEMGDMWRGTRDWDNESQVVAMKDSLLCLPELAIV